MKIWNRQFVTILLINTAIFLGFNMAASGFPAYTAHLESTNIITGLVTSVSAAAALLIRPAAGYASDSPNGRILFLLGLICMSAPLLCPLAPNIGIILILRFLQGAGWGMASTFCSKSIANTLPRERLSEGIGYAGLCSSIAAAFAPGLAVSTGSGYGFTAMFVLIGSCPVLALFLFLVSGYRGDEIDRCVKGRDNPPFRISLDLFVPSFLIMTITMSYAPMVTFIVPYSREMGIAGTTGFFLAYAFATVIARPLAGLYVDRKDISLPTKLALLSMAAAAALLFCFRSSGSLAAAGAFAGIGTGAGMNALQTLSAVKAGRKRRGTAMAVFLFGFDLGMALGSFMASILSDIFGFPKMFILMSVPALVAFALFTAVQSRHSV